MILTSQQPVSRWHEQIGDPTLADGILDRLVHNAHRIEMPGESVRKQRGEKGEKRTPIGRPKAVEQPANNALGNRCAISTFRTAETTTNSYLTIVITLWKIRPPASPWLRRVITSIPER
jgi:IstB-like ATP binding protein